MLVVFVRRTWQGLESVEGQVSADIGGVVQVSEPDLVARGVALDLLQMAKRVGPQCEAAEYKDLSGEENLALDRYQCQNWWISGRESRTMRLRLMVTGDGGHDVYQVRALSMEVIPYFLLD